MSSIRESQLYFTASTAKASLVFIPLLGFVSTGTQASAQVIPANDGGQTVVDVISDAGASNVGSMGERIDITGGQRSDDSSNLFQSFEQFDISAEQTANFVTTPDVQNVIGKVNGGGASNVDGTLQVSGSDANLYLMNPAGVLMGPNAQLNLPGSFTATTATGIGFENGEFAAVGSSEYAELNGEPATFNFDSAQAGAVVNLGGLSVAEGQAINLVGGTVVNGGELNAPGGSVTMAAVEGDSTVRISQSNQLLSLEVDKNNSALVSNGAITPLSIGEMLTGSGLENATTLVTAADGTVSLSGSDTVISEAGGEAIASGTLNVRGELGGEINVLGDRIELIDATLDASGTSDGGAIRVGGDYQGKGTVVNATHTGVDTGSSLLANSTNDGDGGSIIIWSDNTTDFYGSIAASGGLFGGNGGFAEVSGKASLNFRGSANLEAPAGNFGTLLLDPKKLVVTDGAAPANSVDTSYISRSDIEGFSGNIILSADDGIAIEDLSNNQLMLQQDVQITFRADDDSDGIGSFVMNDSSDVIRVEQGNVNITGAGISVGTISTYTDEHDNGGNSGLSGGSVTLTSSLGVVANEILTYGRYDGGHHSGDGGNVTINAEDTIVVERTIQTDSSVLGREAGDGGNIVLHAGNSIRVGNESLSGARVLLTQSKASSYISGRGGDISLVSDNGAVEVIGNISTASATNGSDNTMNSNAGNGGNVFIQAELDIGSGDILTQSSAKKGENAGNGGTITIAEGQNITIGGINTTTSAIGGSVGAGGDVDIKAEGILAIEGVIDTFSVAKNGSQSKQAGDVSLEARTVEVGDRINAYSMSATNAGQGGNITIEAKEEISTRASINAYSSATGGAYSSNGGNVTLTAPTLSIGNEGGSNGTIETSSRANSDAKSGGVITINAQESATINGNLKAYSYTRSGNNTLNGGAISVTANDITVGNIESWSWAANDNSAKGGNVSLLAYDLTQENSSVSTGSIQAQSTANANADDSGNVTISAATVVASSIDASSVASISDSKNGGTVEISAQNSLNILGGLNTSSQSEFGGDSGDGGKIILTSNAIDIGGSIRGWSKARDNSGNGANVSLTAYEQSNSQIEIGGNISTYSLADLQAESGGSVSLTSETIDINRINTSSKANNVADSAGNVELFGANNLTVNDIVATSSTEGNSTAIVLTSDDLTLTGGELSLSGKYVWFKPASSETNVAVGGLSTSVSSGQLTPTLDILRTTLRAVDADESIRIGHADSTGDIAIKPGASNGLGTPLPISILGGQTLIGPDNSDYQFDLTGMGQGEILGSNRLTFSNIENLVGGNQDDTFMVGAGVFPGGFDSIAGGAGSNKLSYAQVTGSLTADLRDLNIVDIQSIVGNGNDGTLRGYDADNRWTLDGKDEGTVNNISFIGFSNLTGGLDQDTFEIGAAGELTGQLSGGEGTSDKIDFSAYGDEVVVDIESQEAAGLASFTEIERIEGGSANSVVIKGGSSDDVLLVTGDRSGVVNNDLEISGIGSFDGQGGENVVSLQRLPDVGGGNWVVSGEDRGSVNGIDFSSVSNLLGGIGEDTFEFEGDGKLNGRLDGSLGDDVLDYGKYQQAVDIVIGAADVTAPGILSIDDVERVTGSAFSDVLRSAVDNSVFKIESSYAGSVDNVSFSGFERVEGNNNSIDRLDYSNYSEAIEIDLEAGQIVNSLSFGNIEEIVGSTSDSDSVRGRNGDERFVVGGESGAIANGTLSFFSVEVVDGGLGSNTIGLEGSEGQWTIDGVNSGEVNGVRFENFDRLEGSELNDTFAVQSGGEVEGSVEGKAGENVVSYASYDTTVSVDLEENSSTAIGSFKEIESIVGSQLDADLIAGSNRDDRFEITGDRTGIINNSLTFSGIENLNGAKGDDTFIFDNLTVASGISVRGGERSDENNTVQTNAANTVWTITDTNAGRLSQADIALTDFSQIQSIQNTSLDGNGHSVLFDSSRARITGTIDSGSRDLNLIGDSIEIGNNNGGSNGRVTGTGKLIIRPSDSALAIELGGNGSDGTNALNLNAREIEAIEDGFSEVVFGTTEQSGNIRFLESANFETPVALRTQGNVEIPNDRRFTAGGDIKINAGNSVSGGTVASRLGSVEISSLEDIQLDAVSSGGGGGVNITSTNGQVSVLDKITSSTVGVSPQENRTVSGDVEIVAERAIAVGNIMTASSRRSGDVTLTSRTGGIVAGGIDTNNRQGTSDSIAEASGSVALTSPGSIQIEFIDARGGGDNTEQTSIRVETEGDFSASGSIGTSENDEQEASISTRGANGGQVYIQYGLIDRLANPFRVGNESENGTAFGIETNQTTLISGGLFNYNEGEGIEIVTNGIVPINTSLEAINKDSNVPDFRLVSAGSERAAAAVFNQVESRNNEEFGERLGINSGVGERAATLSDVQLALTEVAQATQVQPALIYAYFVPDATSEEAVGLNSPLQSAERRAAQPDDQLEVMVITPEGIPTVRRQWGVSRRQVDEASRELREKATSQVSAAQEYLKPAQQLYRWIVEPIEEILEQQGSESLGFVMDTGLRTMPVATLHDGESYLVEKYSLGLLPSFSLTDIDTTGGESFRESQVLAMGASEFESQPDLPAVDAEVSMISEGLWKGDVFLNEEFVLENLQRQLQSKEYGILHLATHASFESGDLKNSYIQLWDEKLSLDRMSDLALEEENLGLIILSACNTALGDQAAEYGFAGLAVSSGSKSALASLWPVSDEGTLGFMTQFYDELKTSSVKTEALRQAQIRMIRGEVGIVDGTVYGPGDELLTTLPALSESGQWDFSHPFYWSAFTMIGNPW